MGFARQLRNGVTILNDLMKGVEALRPILIGYEYRGERMDPAQIGFLIDLIEGFLYDLKQYLSHRGHYAIN